jgi:putative acetyltransferase
VTEKSVAAIRRSTAADIPALIDIWRLAVLATHHFLSQADFEEIAELVSTHYLPHAPLWVAVDERDVPCAFMGLSGAHIDSLFVAPGAHGKGIGRGLVAHAHSLSGRLTVDVNEQNHQALGFYLSLGFEPTGRSDTDDAGRPYPLVHLRMAGDAIRRRRAAGDA